MTDDSSTPDDLRQDAAAAPEAAEAAMQAALAAQRRARQALDAYNRARRDLGEQEFRDVVSGPDDMHEVADLGGTGVDTTGDPGDGASPQPGASRRRLSGSQVLWLVFHFFITFQVTIAIVLSIVERAGGFELPLEQRILVIFGGSVFLTRRLYSRWTARR